MIMYNWSYLRVVIIVSYERGEEWAHSFGSGVLFKSQI